MVADAVPLDHELVPLALLAFSESGLVGILIMSTLFDGGGDGSGGTSVVVGSVEAAGVVIEGDPGPLYGPGEHEIVPKYRTGQRYEGEHWFVEQFRTDVTTIFWSDGTMTGDTDAAIVVDVSDPRAVWHRTTDPGRPLVGALERLAEEVTRGSPAFTELSPREITEPAGSNPGLGVQAMVSRRSNSARS